MATEYFNDAWRIPNNKNQSLVSNYSMEFDGTNDFVNISNPTQLTDDFTIAAWIYPTRVDNSYEMIYTQGDGTVPAYFAVKDTKLHVYITGQYETALGFINANEWQHVAVTRTSGVLNLYKNGVEYNGNRPTQNGTINNNSDGVIGKWYNNTHHFQGKIDQVCIFDYALPAAGTNSIATLYGGGTAVTNPMVLNPVAYYQLGDQSVDNGANYLVPNNSLQDYVFNIQPSQKINTTLTPPTGANNRTFSVWFKTGVNAFENICGYGTNSAKQGFDIITFTNGTVGVHGVNTQVEASGTFVLNEWNHYAVTYDGTILRGYVNGQPVNTSTIALNTGTNVDFTIGAGAYTPANGFSGDVSNIAIWNSVLTASNVSTIYNNGEPNDISSLSPNNWYKLNAADTFDGTNWTIKDYAGSNDGTSFNMTSANLVQSNLQHTSGYSPYALSLDGSNDYFPLGSGSSLNFTGDLSISFWIKTTDTRNSPSLAGKWGAVGIRNWIILHNNGIVTFVVSSTGTAAGNGSITGNTIVNDGNWHHVLVVNDSTTTNNYIYIDGYQDATANVGRSIVGTATPTFIGINSVTSGLRYSGDMSNFAFWNTVVTPEQVNEIYNQGVPTNLNTFSGATPLHWWQLGSNSSFNAGSWTCLDETGTLNAVSSPNMTEDDIVNGVGYSGNGLGTSSIEIIGSAPYSTANGISNSMDVLSRSTDLPPTV